MLKHTPVWRQLARSEHGLCTGWRQSAELGPCPSKFTLLLSKADICTPWKYRSYFYPWHDQAVHDHNGFQPSKASLSSCRACSKEITAAGKPNRGGVRRGAEPTERGCAQTASPGQTLLICPFLATRGNKAAPIPPEKKKTELTGERYSSAGERCRASVQPTRHGVMFDSNISRVCLVVEG